MTWKCEDCGSYNAEYHYDMEGEITNKEINDCTGCGWSRLK